MGERGKEDKRGGGRGAGERGKRERDGGGEREGEREKGSERRGVKIFLGQKPPLMCENYYIEHVYVYIKYRIYVYRCV